MFELVRQDPRLVTERLTQLARDAGCQDPDEVASALLLLYNGVLSSLLGGEPSEPIARARGAARLVLSSCTAPALWPSSM